MAIAFKHSLLLLSIASIFYSCIEARRKYDHIGICYGDYSDNLPDANKVVKFYQTYGVTKLRLYTPNAPVLLALNGAGIELILGVANPDLPALAASKAAAEQWFATNVVPYAHNVSIPYIVMGNEIMPGPFGDSLLPAMINLQKVLDKHHFQGTKVSTALNMGMLKNDRMEPSAATFMDETQPLIAPILRHLVSIGAPILLNVLPYYPYMYNPKYIHLDYALFTARGTVVKDGSLNYTNLFDAMTDSFIWAIEKSGVKGLNVVVSESGWPRYGNGRFTSPTLAATYNNNYLKHILTRPGTPKLPPSKILSFFLYNLIDENRNPAGRGDQHFGVLNLDLRPNYHINLFH